MDQIEKKKPLKYGYNFRTLSGKEVSCVGETDFIAAAAVLQDDTGFHSLFFSLDGRADAPVSDEDWFRVWLMLAGDLLKRGALPEGKIAMLRAPVLLAAELLNVNLK